MISLKHHARRSSGQCLIETIVGMFVLIPIALAMLDLVTLVLANSANDTLAKNAAREAANQTDANKAQVAAQVIVNRFHTSNIIPQIQMNSGKFSYDQQNNVKVETDMVVVLPVEFPGMPQKRTFVAAAQEPVVASNVTWQ